jgi:beta-glucosidase
MHDVPAAKAGRPSFPADFAWGVASASYQIEGSPTADGKGPSVWDMFCRKPGAIWGGQTGDVACDGYRLWREDVRLLKELGIKAYRFSLSWPRVLPEGTGAVNPKGLDFYSRLVDGLLEAGVAPWVTLFHWDYPLALYHRGGWLNRDSAQWFAEYASQAARALSDRVSHWMTLNEPQCFIGLGLQTGYHAPGDRLRLDEVLRAGHHALLAHGRGVQAIRAAAPSPVAIGMAPVGVIAMPAAETAADIEAARRATFSVVRRDCFSTSWWLDPVFRGAYPKEGLSLFGDAAPRVAPADMKTIAQPLDFCGINIYHGSFVQAGPGGGPEDVPLPPGYPKTAFDYWPITPACLYWGPRFLHERYGLPVVITENGHQNVDVVALDGKVHDPERIDYLHRHLKELSRAHADGVPVGGYFQWCFTDNFEWAYGDSSRNGIVFTEYPTQARIPKDSAYWYRDVIRTNGAGL